MELSFTAKRTGRQFFVNIKSNAISVIVDETTVYTFDRAGRLSTAVIDERTYRRGLTNQVLCKWREGSENDRRAQRRWLSEVETRQLIDGITADLGEVVAALEGDDLLSADPPYDPALIAALCPWLKRAAAFDFEAAKQEAERTNRVYLPVSILPPDQYLALVLQVTEGCHYNRCSFCSFYRDRPFRIKSLPEFRKHMAEVLELLGDGVTIRRSVFLADANAVCIPQDHLISILDAVNETLPIRRQSAADAATALTYRSPCGSIRAGCKTNLPAKASRWPRTS